MKIIYISIAVVLLSVAGYFAYQWYQGRKTSTPTPTTTTVTTHPHIVAGTPIAVHITSLATK